jgi:hypothetical protein
MLIRIKDKFVFYFFNQNEYGLSSKYEGVIYQIIELAADPKL